MGRELFPWPICISLPTELSSSLDSSQTSGDEARKKEAPYPMLQGRVCGEAQVSITAGTWSKETLRASEQESGGDLRPETRASVSSQTENGPCLWPQKSWVKFNPPHVTVIPPCTISMCCMIEYGIEPLGTLAKPRGTYPGETSPPIPAIVSLYQRDFQKRIFENKISLIK